VCGEVVDGDGMVIVVGFECLLPSRAGTGLLFGGGWGVEDCLVDRARVARRDCWISVVESGMLGLRIGMLSRLVVVIF
jgi:hypothetical protein